MQPIFVLIFWLMVSGDKVQIRETELAAIVDTPAKCAQIDVLEVIGKLEDAKENIAKGLMPAVVCGIAAPVKKPEPTAPPTKESPESSPGNGVWGKGPSGDI